MMCNVNNVGVYDLEALIIKETLYLSQIYFLVYMLINISNNRNDKYPSQTENSD